MGHCLFIQFSMTTNYFKGNSLPVVSPVLHSYTMFEVLLLGTDQSTFLLIYHSWYTHLSHLLVTIPEQFLSWQR